MRSIMPLHNPPVEVRRSAFGHGVFAVRDIRAGEVLFVVPINYSMGRGAALPPSLRRLVHRANEEENLNKLRSCCGEAATVAELLLARAIGELSPMAAYIRLLPKQIEPTYAWSDAELAQLQDDGLVRRLLALRREEDAQFGAFRPLLAQMLVASAALGGEGARGFTRERFQWARGMLHSRSLRTRDSMSMLPGPEMINFAPLPQRASPDRTFEQQHQVVTLASLLATQGLARPHRRDAHNVDVFVVRADRDTAAGREVYEEYAVPSTDLLLYSDFSTEARNWNDCASEPSPPTGPRTAEHYARVHRAIGRYCPFIRGSSNGAISLCRVEAPAHVALRAAVARLRQQSRHSRSTRNTPSALER